MISNTSSVSTRASARTEIVKHMTELPAGNVMAETDTVKSSPIRAGHGNKLKTVSGSVHTLAIPFRVLGLESSVTFKLKVISVPSVPKTTSMHTSEKSVLSSKVYSPCSAKANEISEGIKLYKYYV